MYIQRDSGRIDHISGSDSSRGPKQTKKHYVNMCPIRNHYQDIRVACLYFRIKIVLS